jgi:hypothetical protein
MDMRASPNLRLTHARFVVNAAKSVAFFLVDSYAFRQTRGTLSGHGDHEAHALCPSITQISKENADGQQAAV